MELSDNKYANKLRSRFGIRFEVELFENYTGDPLNPIPPCVSCRVGVQGEDDYFPCETFQIANGQDIDYQKLSNSLYEVKCGNLWVRTKDDPKLNIN